VIGQTETVSDAQFNPSDWIFVESQDQLQAAAEELYEGIGPIGVDAERASGFTYFSNAYLLQISRRGAGTYVFDPTSIDDFEPVIQALQSEEWILHAAIADLQSLEELGFVPANLFDTELSARLLGMERVGLGAVLQETLGVELAKAHSAADWSTRPLPHSWLEYAALDVSYLPDLRDVLHNKLVEDDKLDIAYQEFEALLKSQQKATPQEPWRRISKLSQVNNRIGLSIARELWHARDEYAMSINVAPGRLLPDSSIITAATNIPRSPGELAKNKDFRGRASRTELQRWWRAILRGKKSDDLPSLRPLDRAPFPPHRLWERKHPEAYRRLSQAREALSLEAEQLRIPLENLLKPDVLRQLAWSPPTIITDEAIRSRLEELGARSWQQQATTQIIASSFVDTQ